MADSEIASLYMTLSAVTESLIGGFAEVTESGEQMVTDFLAGMDEMSAAVDRVAESLVALREEMTTVAGTTVGAGAEAGVGAGAAGGGDAGAAAAAATEEASVVSTATEDMTASWDRALVAMRADIAAMDTSQTEYAAGTEAFAAKYVASMDTMVAGADTAAASTAKVTTAVVEADSATPAWISTLSSLSGAFLKAGLAGGVLAGASVDMAAKLQSSITRLGTSGGELTSNLQSDQRGVLTLAGQVGDSAQTLAQALYTATSAGFQGAQGLEVLKASAQGAATENANLGTVVNGVTDILNDYHLHANSAALVTSQMVEATSQGKVSFQDLSGALSTIVPTAAAVTDKISDFLGVLAQMTSHGVSAKEATQQATNAIREFEKPNSVMTAELGQLGLNANTLSEDLGTKGLAGTLQEVEEAVAQHMGPAGTVVLNLMNTSQIAAQKAQTAMRGLGGAAQQLAQQYASGQMAGGFKAWSAALSSLSAPQANLLSQWKTLQDQSQGFSNALKTGNGDVQSFAQAMEGATGTSSALQVALLTTGENMNATNAKIAAIAKTTTEAGNNVQGWSTIQGTFNQQLAQAKDGFLAAATAVGVKLLPAITSVLHGVGQFTSFLASNKVALDAVVAVIGTLLIGGLIGVIGKMVAFGASMVMNVIGPIKGTVTFTKNLIGGFQGVEGAADTAGGKVANVLSSIGSGFSKMGNLIASGAKAVGSFASSVGSGLVSAVSSAGSAFLSAAKTAAMFIADMAGNALAALGNFAALIKTTVVGALESMGTVLMETVLPAIGDAIVATWSFTVALLANPITWIVIALIALGVAVYELITHWRQVVAFFDGLWKDIKTIFGAAISWVVNLVKGWGDDFLSLVSGIWRDVSTAFSQGIDDVINFVTGLVTKIVTAEAQMVIDAINWVASMWSKISDFFSSLPGKIGSFIESVVNGLIDKWNEIINDVGQWLSNMWSSIGNWFGSLGDKIMGLLSGAGQWLLNAGKQILQGFLNGLLSVWHDVTNFIGGIGSWISNNKGPIEVDRTLLTPHGNAVMDGFLDGLKAGGGRAQSYLTAFTKSLSSTASAGLSGTVPLGMTPMTPLSGGSGTQTTVNMPITIQGNVTTQNDLIKAIQQGMLRLSSRNPGFGTNVVFTG